MTERAEHTAGPWDYCKPHKRWLVYPKSALNDGIDYFISEAINVDGREQEARANARLIAAAPDLLRELQDVLEWALVEKAPLREKEIRSIRKALSRATGEA